MNGKISSSRTKTIADLSEEGIVGATLLEKEVRGRSGSLRFGSASQLDRAIASQVFGVADETSREGFPLESARVFAEFSVGQRESEPNKTPEPTATASGAGGRLRSTSSPLASSIFSSGLQTCSRFRTVRTRQGERLRHDSAGTSKDSQ